MIEKIKFLIKKNFRLEFTFLNLSNLIGSLVESIGLALLPFTITYIIDSEKIFLSFPFLRNIIPSIPSIDDLFIIFFVIILIFLLKNLFLLMIFYLECNLIRKIRESLQLSFFKKYLNQPYEDFQKSNFFKVLTNSVDEINISVNIVSNISGIIKEVSIIIFLVLLLLLNNNSLSLISLMILVFVAAIIYLSLKNYIKYNSKDSIILRSKIVKSINESLSSLNNLNFLKKKNFFIDQHKSLINKAGNKIINVSLATYSGKPILELLVVTSFFSILYILLSQGKSFLEITPELSFLAIASVRLAPSFNGIITHFTNFKNRAQSLIKLYNENIKLENNLVKRNQMLKTFQKSNLSNKEMNSFLEIQNLSFKYKDNEKFILNKVSLNIQKGDVVSINGKSGSGKSTLVKIILGLYIPDEGNIFYCGKSIYENLDEWQKRISYVDQDIFLFDESLKKNICLGLNNDEINYERLNHIYDLCDIREIIAFLPKGENTFVGKDGSRLSGGQKQRIGIARALYFENEIIILDEATNSLDQSKQYNILKSIQSMKNNTIIKISHRQETLEDANKKFLLDSGNIILQ